MEHADSMRLSSELAQRVASLRWPRSTGGDVFLLMRSQRRARRAASCELRQDSAGTTPMQGADIPPEFQPKFIRTGSGPSPLGHEDFVSSVAFSPDGARVLTGSGDKTARCGTYPASQKAVYSISPAPGCQTMTSRASARIMTSISPPIRQKDETGKYKTPLPD